MWIQLQVTMRIFRSPNIWLSNRSHVFLWPFFLLDGHSLLSAWHQHLHMNSHCRLKHKRFYLWMCARSLNVRAFDENVVHVPIILLSAPRPLPPPLSLWCNNELDRRSSWMAHSNQATVPDKVTSHLQHNARRPFLDLPLERDVLQLCATDWKDIFAFPLTLPRIW